MSFFNSADVRQHFACCIKDKYGKVSLCGNPARCPSASMSCPKPFLPIFIQFLRAMAIPPPLTLPSLPPSEAIRVPYKTSSSSFFSSESWSNGKNFLLLSLSRRRSREEESHKRYIILYHSPKEEEEEKKEKKRLFVASSLPLFIEPSHSSRPLTSLSQNCFAGRVNSNLAAADVAVSRKLAPTPKREKTTRFEELHPISMATKREKRVPICILLPRRLVSPNRLDRKIGNGSISISEPSISPSLAVYRGKKKFIPFDPRKWVQFF